MSVGPNDSDSVDSWELLSPNILPVLATRDPFESYLAVVQTFGPGSIAYSVSFAKESSRDAFSRPLDNVIVSKQGDSHKIVNIGGSKSVVVEYVATDIGNLMGTFTAGTPGSFDVEVYNDINLNSILDLKDEKLLSNGRFASKFQASLSKSGGRGFLKI